MAKWINFNVVGGVSNGAGALAPQMDGDNLVLAENVLTVAAQSGPAPGDPMTAQLTLAGPAGAQLVSLILATSPDAGDAPEDNVPASDDYLNKVKAAINRALTANPGGVKSNCTLPQDNDDATAAYDPALRVYWRSFVVS